jgi:hypothetical protein
VFQRLIHFQKKKKKIDNGLYILFIKIYRYLWWGERGVGVHAVPAGVFCSAALGVDVHPMPVGLYHGHRWGDWMHQRGVCVGRAQGRGHGV